MKKYIGRLTLVEKFAEANGIPKSKAGEYIDSFIDLMKESILDENFDGIQLIDFITLQRKEYKERLGRNPRKPEEEIFIPARVKIKAEVGKKFDEALNTK